MSMWVPLIWSRRATDECATCAYVEADGDRTCCHGKEGKKDKR